MSESQVEVKFEKADEETLNVVSKYWNFSVIFKSLTEVSICSNT